LKKIFGLRVVLLNVIFFLLENRRAEWILPRGVSISGRGRRQGKGIGR
jgi:hypothetical protein